jgi:hypothetical protein
LDNDKKRYYPNSKPEISKEMLETSIVNNWNKQIIINKWNPTETTYFLFDNLYRIIKGNYQKMELTFDTLIRLNKEIDNEKMVKILKIKKDEYFVYLEESSPYFVESSD